MNVVETAKAQVMQIVEKVAEKVTDAAATDSQVQAITIAHPRGDVVKFLRDADHLSRIFGDIADVHRAGPDRLRWSFLGPGGGVWDCVIAVEGDNRLRYVDVNPDRPLAITLDLSDAPQDRGTEILGRVTAPAPGVLTGSLMFKALYRARALLQTGEVPTIKHNPSGRASQR